MSSVKKILLVGRQLTQVPGVNEVSKKNIELYVASMLDEARSAFEKHKNKIDIVIMGAGIELEKRLEIVRYVFNTSNITSVHMKDWESGPEGFIPFINKVLNGLLG